MNATPAKLKNGLWGARVQGAPKVGDEITVTTRAGKTWQARIADVVWFNSKEQIALCKTESLDRPHPRMQYPRQCNCNSLDCCRPCRCDAHCVCRGGNIYDC